MDSPSSMPYIVVPSVVPQEVYLVDDKLCRDTSWLHLAIVLMLFFGSLPRPPDVPFNAVCILLNSIYRYVGCGNLCDVVVIVVWRTLEASFVRREEELILASLSQNLAYGIGESLLVCTRNHVFILTRGFKLF
ncbi:unnamed protein product [Arabidopsis lyrata]|uniref:Predicted protein n=1 Tax=Arabidopsis lyrata subsp. lyrata TaxID=81972 RepID=D7KYM4_ARALL|nr:predicted protein [Arabidopsis lyrata subsp. lyrata]CAH8256581.1 unnamed protein product [Arabidopsis lyrata]